jgi:hypothetical protein
MPQVAESVRLALMKEEDEDGRHEDASVAAPIE